MGYVVLKNPKDHNFHNGKTVLHNGLLWNATNLAPHAVFNSREEVQEAIRISKQRWPKAKFEIMDETEMVIGVKEKPVEKLLELKKSDEPF